jgi:hypothetical protein
MTAYTDYVKERMADMRDNGMSSPEKMKVIASEWRQGAQKPATKKAPKKKGPKKGGMLAGGQMLVGGGKNPKMSDCGCHKSKAEHKKATKGGAIANPHEFIYLENGVPLHPDMIGGGFWGDFWRGFKMPFEAIGKVASSPVGKIAMTVAPFIL